MDTGAEKGSSENTAATHFTKMSCSPAVGEAGHICHSRASTGNAGVLDAKGRFLEGSNGLSLEPKWGPS